MPNCVKADLLIHPVRLQIFQVLANQSLTTAKISQPLQLDMQDFQGLSTQELFHFFPIFFASQLKDFSD
jgi:hypothetical protein